MDEKQKQIEVIIDAVVRSEKIREIFSEFGFDTSQFINILTDIYDPVKSDEIANLIATATTSANDIQSFQRTILVDYLLLFEEALIKNWNIDVRFLVYCLYQDNSVNAFEYIKTYFKRLWEFEVSNAFKNKQILSCDDLRSMIKPYFLKKKSDENPAYPDYIITAGRNIYGTFACLYEPGSPSKISSVYSRNHNFFQHIKENPEEIKRMYNLGNDYRLNPQPLQIIALLKTKNIQSVEMEKWFMAGKGNILFMYTEKGFAYKTPVTFETIYIEWQKINKKQTVYSGE